MSQTEADCCECTHCDLCHKEGLPILLTRYAVATKDSRSLYEDYRDISEPNELYPKFKDSGEKIPHETPAAALEIFNKRFNEIINADAVKGLKASGAPDIQSKANFDIVAKQNGKPISLGDHAYYTLRLLRPGFVYVYNPNVPKDSGIPTWRGYHVVGGPAGDEGAENNHQDNDKDINLNKKKEIDRTQWKGIFMMPFDVEDEDRGKPQKVAPCAPQKNGVAASCITISPEELPTAETIWIAYSDVKWSPAVLERYTEDTGGCRTKNMRAIDVKKYGKNKHAASIDELADHVAEYAKNLNVFAFDFASMPMPTLGPYYKEGVAKETVKDFLAKNPATSIKNLLNQTPAEFMIHKSKKLNKNAFFVALDDPAGIAADLAELMDERFDDFLAQPTVGRKFAASASIVSLRTAVLNQADLRCIETAKENRENYFGKRAREMFTAAAPHLTSADAMRITTPHDVDKKFGKREEARDYKKDPYAPHKDGTWEEWRDNYESYGLLSAPAFDVFRQSSWNRYQYDLPSDARFKDFIVDSLALPFLPDETKASEMKASEMKASETKATETTETKATETEKKRFDDKLLVEFTEQYEKKRAKFEKDCIMPLAHAHAAWMRSQAMVNYFRWHFERNDPRFGVEILNILGDCIGGTQDKGPCAELYEQWMNPENVEEVLAESNLIWQGFLIGGLLGIFPAILKVMTTLKLETTEDKLTRESVQRTVQVENNAEARMTPTVGTPKERDIASAAKSKTTGSKGLVDAALGKGAGKIMQTWLDTQKNFKKAQEAWIDPKLFDVETLEAMPLLSRTYEAFKFLIVPLTDVATFVLRSGQDSTKQPDNKIAEYLNKFIGGWLNRFITRVSGPAARVFLSCTDQGKIAPLLFYMSAAERQPVVLTQTPGTTRDLARHVVRLVTEHSNPGNTTIAKLTDLVDDRMRVLQADAVNRAPLNAMQYTRTATHIPYGDLEKLRQEVALYPGMTNIEKADFHAFFNRSLKHVPIDIQNAIHEGRYQDAAKMFGLNRQIIHHGGESGAVQALQDDILKFERKNYKVVQKIALTGTFQGLLSWATLASAVKKLKKAKLLEEGRFDAWGRLAGAVASSLYMVSTALASFMKNAKKIGRFARRMIHPKFTYKWVEEVLAKRIFFRGAAVILGAMELFMGVKRNLEEKYLEGMLYFGSSFAAFLGLHAWFAKGAPMVTLLLISLALIVAIEIIRDDDFQTWLSKCCFGYDKNHYPSMKLEVLAIEEAGK